MFSIGDTILYNPAGVCTIDDIREESIMDEEMEYYILKPVYRSASTIYVPVENGDLTAKMMPLLEEKDIQAIMKKSTSSVTWIEDSKSRIADYMDILAKGQRMDTIQVIRLLLRHKEEVLQSNHKFYATDEKILNLALKLIGEEFGYVLKQDPEEIFPKLLK